MRHLDLFSGIGGFAYAAQQVWGDEHKIVAFCEIDKFCQKVLKKHWPDTEIIEDIKDYEPEGLEGTVDILTGGFPCQPISVAGNRKGNADHRWLWPDMLRIIKAVRPTWIIAENTANLKNMGLDEILDDLEASSYETTQLVIPAFAVGLPHKRNRLYLVAHADSIDGGGQSQQSTSQGRESRNQSQGRGTDLLSDTKCAGLEGDVSEVLERAFKGRQDADFARPDWGLPTPRICGRIDGIQNRVDRLKSLGNAIVPQIAMIIMQAIKETEWGMF